LYQQVQLALEGQILSGRLRQGEFLPPEPELCRRFAVSAITIRRALTELARDGLIRRKGGVGTVVTGRSRRVRFALLFIGFDDVEWAHQGEIFGTLLGGIGDAAWRANADFSTIRTVDDEALPRVLKRILDEREFDGVLLRTAGDVRPDWLTLLEGRDMPYVSIKRHIEGRPMNVVSMDDVDASCRATTHLIELGHRRIGLLVGPLDISPRRSVLVGYRQALEAHGLPFAAELVRELPRPLGGESEGSAALQSLLELADRPTAACTNGSFLTIGAFDALAHAGLRIPDDMAIVGHGDMRLTRALRPPLTRIDTPYAEIGRLAANTLFELIANPERAPVEVFLRPPLVVGGSSGAVAQSVDSQRRSSPARRETRRATRRARPVTTGLEKTRG